MTKKTKGRPRLSEADRTRADAHLERTLEPLDGLSDKIDVGGGTAPIPRTEAVREQAGDTVPAGPVMGGSAQHAAQLSSDLRARSGHPTLAERVQREGVRAQYGPGITSEDSASVSRGRRAEKTNPGRMSKRKKRRRRGGR